MYDLAVAQARRPEFYANARVPDTIDGRFEMVALHVYLLLRRMRGAGGQADSAAQALIDRMAADMDANLREIGIGDLAVPKRVYEILGAFYGRAKVYDAALAGPGMAGLAEAIDRNVFGSVEADPQGAAVLADYVRREEGRLAALPVSELLGGRFAFGPPPAAG
ncbi:MAG TPA: ubiquinol-cytochrome C chaperone family protein [Azospirillaceae bacterium]|nr:ubiquinol-cytochrome C chaperone family protein [Azospirillaceae bacterium]